MEWRSLQLTVAFVGVALVAFGICLWFTNAAWEANKQSLRAIRVFWRALPVRWRAMRDPEFRKRAAAAGDYEAAVEDMLVARFTSRDIASAGFEGTKRIAQEIVMKRREEGAERTRENAVRTLLAFDDEMLRHVAVRVHERWLEGRSSVDEVVAFLAEEQALLRDRPTLIDGHVTRFSQRFARDYMSAE